MSTTKPIRALARGLEVIQVLNERHSTPLSLLSEQTGLSRATLLRILNTLDAVGWIYRYRANGNYRLSSKICRLGQHLLTVDRIAESAAPVMDRLYREVGWPSDIAVCTGHGMQIVESTRRARPKIDNLPSDHAPMLWSAVGRAYLAFCPTAERELILGNLRDSPECLDQAVYDQRWIEGLLEDARARGYGVAEPDGERRLNGKRGLGAIAVPVRTNGCVRACLSLVWIEGEDNLCRISGEWLPTLLAAAQEIADSLRWREAQDAT